MAIKTNKQIVELLRATGHLEYPFGTQQSLSKPVDKFKISDPEVLKAIASYQDFFIESLEGLAIKEHGRPARADGDLGPATRTIVSQLRCEHPDYGPKVGQAQGSGGWRGCHNVGNFHAATFYINESGMGSHLRSVFSQVIDNTIASYAELGLKLIRVQTTKANLTTTFVSSSSGWIGLALIGPGSCNSTLWARFLASFRPSNTLREWTTLWKHEWGHNVGLEHSRGGVMNPSILQGLPISWKGDPHWPTLARMYGGEPVPGVGGPDKEYWVSQCFKSNRGRELCVPLNPPLLIGE